MMKQTFFIVIDDQSKITDEDLIMLENAALDNDMREGLLSDLKIEIPNKQRYIVSHYDNDDGMTVIVRII